MIYMNKKTKLLIISAEAGAGHIRAGEAIFETAKILYPDIDVRHIKITDYISSLSKKIFFDSYNVFAVRYPKIYEKIYNISNKKQSTKKIKKILKFLQKIDGDKFLKYIFNFNPDYIINTHFLAQQILVNNSKQLENLKGSSTVITDYAFHHLWSLGFKNQNYFVANQQVKQSLLSLSVPDTKIYVSGIPIHPAFYQKKDLNKLRIKYQIPKTDQVILVLSGGKGLSFSDKLIEELSKIESKATIFAITGKNQKLLNKIKKLKLPINLNLRVISWTDQIDEYIRISDVIISKAGGLSTTECLTLGKYLIIIDPIPGQEVGNANFLKQNKLVTVAKDKKQLVKLLEKTPSHISEDNLREFAKPSAEIILKNTLN